MTTTMGPATFEDVVSSMGFDETQTAQILSRFFSMLASLVSDHSTVGESLTEDEVKTVLVNACNEMLDSFSTEKLTEFECRSQLH